MLPSGTVRSGGLEVRRRSVSQGRMVGMKRATQIGRLITIYISLALCANAFKVCLLFHPRSCLPSPQRMKNLVKSHLFSQQTIEIRTLFNSFHIKQAFFLLDPISDIPTLFRFRLVASKTSTTHSYHTPRSSVCRHICTAISAPFGTNNGVCKFHSARTQNSLLREGKHTLIGKKIGNQLIMSLLFCSIVTGFVDSSTLPAGPS
jgi:hypothetical protein